MCVRILRPWTKSSLLLLCILCSGFASLHKVCVRHKGRPILNHWKACSATLQCPHTFLCSYGLAPDGRSIKMTFALAADQPHLFILSPKRIPGEVSEDKNRKCLNLPPYLPVFTLEDATRRVWWKPCENSAKHSLKQGQCVQKCAIDMHTVWNSSRMGREENRRKQQKEIGGR